jgi:hypothetical protein
VIDSVESFLLPPDVSLFSLYAFNGFMCVLSDPGFM